MTKSINVKNKLYNILIQTDTEEIDLYNRFKDKFKTYQAVLHKGIQDVKTELQYKNIECL